MPSTCAQFRSVLYQCARIRAHSRMCHSVGSLAYLDMWTILGRVCQPYRPLYNHIILYIRLAYIVVIFYIPRPYKTLSIIHKKPDEGDLQLLEIYWHDICVYLS